MADQVPPPAALPRMLLHRPRRPRTMELAAWLEDRVEPLSARWLREVQSRHHAPPAGADGALERFLPLLASFLPAMLGPFRDQIEPLWTRAAELFGTTAAHRGLAAGEVIEELQILRECVIRLLYEDPPRGGTAGLSLGDTLRLHRVIDRAVTYASVGHTDALFFSLFEGSGIPGPRPTDTVTREVAAQLTALSSELQEVFERAREDAGEVGD